jgi:hypothetical protein
MESEFDTFDDILGDNDDGGVFAGSGHKTYEGIKQTSQANGIKAEMQCRSCGKPGGLLLDWNELFVIGTNGPNTPVLLPPGWKLSPSNRSAYVELQCSCGKPGFALHVTPDEAAKHVKTAMASGLMPQAQVEQMKAFVRQQRGQ